VGSLRFFFVFKSTKIDELLKGGTRHVRLFTVAKLATNRQAFSSLFTMRKINKKCTKIDNPYSSIAGRIILKFRNFDQVHNLLLKNLSNTYNPKTSLKLLQMVNKYLKLLSSLLKGALTSSCIDLINLVNIEDDLAWRGQTF
jgi:hypothetical protein